MVCARTLGPLIPACGERQGASAEVCMLVSMGRYRIIASQSGFAGCCGLSREVESTHVCSCVSESIKSVTHTHTCSALEYAVQIFADVARYSGPHVARPRHLQPTAVAEAAATHGDR